MFHRHKIKGAALVLVAWIFFTIAIALSRSASKETSVPTVLLAQNLLSMLVVAPWALRRGKAGLRLSRNKLFFVRAIAGYLSFAFTFLAVQRISLVDVNLLINSTPLFIPLIIWAWRGVKIPKRLWLGILIGFAGIAIILKPSCNLTNLGSIFAIGAALAFSISMITQRRLMKRDPIETILFFYFLVSTLISIPFAIETWQPLTMPIVWKLLLLGACFVTGQFCFLSSLKFERPSFLSAFNYSAVVYGALLEWYLWRQFPGWHCIIGILVVFTGGLIAIWTNSKSVD